MLAVVVIAAIAWAIVFIAHKVFDYMKNRNDLSRQDLDDTEARLYDAERTLRQIASDQSGNPILDAQLYFDENYRKEIR